MMVDHPGLRLSGRFISGSDQFHPAESLGAVLQRIRDRNVELSQSVELKLERSIGAHCGFGSGTQLSLAVTEGVARLHGMTLSARQAAEASGRGERSAIGIFGYEQGGFLVDAGHHQEEVLGELAIRLVVPAEWRILMLLPTGAIGLHGREERKAFSQLKPMGESLTGVLSRLVLTEMLPALQAGTFERFAIALEEYGTRVGEFFAASQGGTYASPLIRDLVPKLQRSGVRGMAQSSWGPVVAIPARNQQHLEELRQTVLSFPEGEKCEILATSPRNIGRRLSLSQQD